MYIYGILFILVRVKVGLFDLIRRTAFDRLESLYARIYWHQWKKLLDHNIAVI